VDTTSLDFLSTSSVAFWKGEKRGDVEETARPWQQLSNARRHGRGRLQGDKKKSREKGRLRGDSTRKRAKRRCSGDQLGPWPPPVAPCDLTSSTP